MINVLIRCFGGKRGQTRLGTHARVALGFTEFDDDDKRYLRPAQEHMLEKRETVWVEIGEP